MAKDQAENFSDGLPLARPLCTLPHALPDKFFVLRIPNLLVVRIKSKQVTVKV